jgi:hypothetical protein
MRDLTLFAPEDCIVSNTVEDNAQALGQIASALKGKLTRSADFVFRRRRRRRT